MMVLLLDRVSPSLRGELTRWMLEPRAGVFVGRLSAMVRDRLWDKVSREAGENSGCVMVYATNSEQGFAIRMHGTPSRVIEDFEGLLLVRKG
jgi:CRISPR-associated protein Cas2